MPRVIRIAGVCAAFVVLLAMLAQPVREGREQWNFGQFGDDGVYLVTAKALAQGEGYRVLSLLMHLACGLVVYVLLQKQFIAGVALGSSKG